MSFIISDDDTRVFLVRFNCTQFQGFLLIIVSNSGFCWLSLPNRPWNPIFSSKLKFLPSLKIVFWRKVIAQRKFFDCLKVYQFWHGKCKRYELRQMLFEKRHCCWWKWKPRNMEINHVEHYLHPRGTSAFNQLIDSVILHSNMHPYYYIGKILSNGKFHFRYFITG